MDLSYFNARVRGMRGRLIRASEYETFAALSSIDQYADRLRATAYGPYVETASGRTEKPGDVIVVAVRASLAATFSDMQDSAPSEALPYLRALMCLWEIYDLKVIIRAVSRSIKAEEALDVIVPAGEFDSAAIKTLLTSAKDIPDMISFLETWGSRYAKPLKDGLAAYRKNDSTAAMEHNLDVDGLRAAAAGFAPDTTDGAVIKSIIASRIDAQNIMTLLKLCGGDAGTTLASGVFFLDGGRRLDRDVFLELLGFKDRGALMGALEDSLDDPSWRDVIAEADAEDMGLLEERLACIEDAYLRRLAVTEPQSIALAASYMQMKTREAKNLRFIARAISFGMPEEILKRYIIYPM